MKCEHCGGNISFEVKYCPYCGQLNTQAAQHIKDMEKYKKEFSTTKDEVYRATRKYSAFSVKLIVFTLLVFVTVIIYVLAGNTYSLKRFIEQRNSEKNYTSYCKQIDKYIENKDYFGLNAFTEEHSINSSDKFEKYVMVFRTSRNYQYCYEDIVRLIGCKEEDRINNYYSSLSSSMTTFYKNADPKNYEYYPKEATKDEYVNVCKDMSDNLSCILKGFFNISDEDLEGLSKMSEGKRAYVIESAGFRDK